MKTVEQLAKLPADEQESEIAKLGPWVLVCPPPASDDEWSYRTLSARLYPVTAASGEELVLGAAFSVHSLSKDPGKPFADQVLIGRASSNDVVIKHASVSKLHARLLRRNGALVLTDAGSSNGTFVNDEGLKENEERPVEDGAVLSFGSCPAILMETGRMLRMLE